MVAGHGGRGCPVEQRRGGNVAPLHHLGQLHRKVILMALVKVMVRAGIHCTDCKKLNRGGWWATQTGHSCGI